MTTAIRSFVVKTRDEIRDDILRVKRSALIARGVPSPNVSPKSDAYGEAEAIANELVVVESNAVVASDDLMPDTATGPGLDRWLSSVGLSRRPAAGSVGGIVFDATAASLVSLGQQLLDGAGLTYEVTVGGTYSDGDIIPTAAIDTGAATNHDEGDALRWVGTPPAYAAPTALVAAGGLTGGTETEDDETARSRLLGRMQNPPAAGNWQQCVEFAEAASPAVQKGFWYPAAQGPSSTHGAVVGYATAANKNRDVAAVTMSSVVVPYVIGLLAEHADATVTTVTNVPTDVSIGLSLPAAPTASPPGPGGGWLDASPWPSVDGSYLYGQLDLTTYPPASTTQFTVIARVPPTAGVSHVCWVDQATWTLWRTRVVSYTTPAANHYTVTVDTPLPGITAATGTHFIFPDAANMQAYVDAALAAFANMGPGEKTSNPTALVRAFRHPVPQLGWPYSLDATQLRRISDAGEEVLSASWVYRSTTTPPVPGTITDPPGILVPRAIGVYPLTT